MSNSKYVKLINTVKWRKLRNMKLSDNPLCEICVSKDKVTPAVEVHHVVPVEEGVNFEHMEQLAYDYKNLISLCHSCHVEQHILLASKSKAAARRRSDNLTNNFVSRFLTE